MQENITETVTQTIWGAIKSFLDLGFTLGSGNQEVRIAVWTLLLVILSFVGARLFLKWIRVLLTRNMQEPDKLKFISFFKFVQYITYIIVGFAVLSASGINVTPFLAASAALLVGLGLALQELFQDVIGGVFIFIDKSLLVGDIVEVDGKVARVIEVTLRTTRAITRDDKIVVIPNHKFISEIIINYTQNHKTTRESVKIGVAYGSDVKKVEALLLQSVSEQRGVLKTPKSFVLFDDFGESALQFSVLFFISDSFSVPKIKSEIRFRIDQLFREHNISIPFPQRDIHIINKTV
ncbi:mechanosensitive ion channel [Flavobacteriaceae bacterium]|nr:mechanosensitive ion channel [Flavobacteriaceae bacterium]MDA9272428.1 mechanosensitive ion channel [Flavobacteriaceae bacterium]MDB4325137.1 mechanosensitive ion channel [Flavobacteriaceae bacterium]MDG1269766.1 mechanosensitive ion channel [Ulvibacter sp.]MDG1502238.1 mechanosensitive ion channel [Ulvibacter sp.]